MTRLHPLCRPAARARPQARAAWSAAGLLTALAGRGIVLVTVPDGSILAAPGVLLTEAEREMIREHRDALAPMLAEAVVVA